MRMMPEWSTVQSEDHFLNFKYHFKVLNNVDKRAI